MKKKSVILVLILFIITAATACIYLMGRDEPSEGCLTVLCEGNSKTIDPFSKGLQPVSRVLINGKGEEKEISGSGVPLKDVISLSGIKDGDYQSAKIISSDEYAAYRLRGFQFQTPGKKCRTFRILLISIVRWMRKVSPDSDIGYKPVSVCSLLRIAAAQLLRRSIAAHA